MNSRILDELNRLNRAMERIANSAELNNRSTDKVIRYLASIDRSLSSISLHLEPTQDKPESNDE